jgi:DNA-binding transcriptional regulator YdaS (Cro superfamily)
MLRRAMRLTHANQMSFSRLMGVTQPALSFWLSGKSPVPRWAVPAIVGACVMAGVSVQLPHPAKQLLKHSHQRAD